MNRTSCSLRLIMRFHCFTVLSQQRVYVLSCLLLLSSIGVWCSCTSRATLFAQVNGWQYSWADVLFRATTWLGSGLLYIAVLARLFFSGHPLRHWLGGVLGLALLWVANYWCKHIGFTHLLRPAAWVQRDGLHMIAGVVHKTGPSFPSGHAGVSFAMVTLLVSLWQPRWYYSLFLLLLASWVTYSRVYLGQHCVHDVWGGACLGFGCTALSCSMLQLSYWPDWLDAPSYHLLLRVLQKLLGAH